MIDHDVNLETESAPYLSKNLILLRLDSGLQYTIMRMSFRLSASHSNIGSTQGLKLAPLALLPPIPLYRRLLRAHRKFLPTEMRLLGDQYVKSEFRAHRSVENPIHIIGFLKEWQTYAQAVEGDSWYGDKIEAEKIDKMSGESSIIDFWRYRLIRILRSAIRAAL